MRSITHPITNTGTWRDNTFVLDRSYFDTERFSELAQRNGLSMLFQGWSHPLTAFTRPMADAGLVIEAIREPRWVNADGTTHPLPFHLWFRALRPA